MKKLSVAAILVASLAIVLSAAALWRTRDISSAPKSAPTDTTATIAPVLISVPNEVLKNSLIAASELAKLNLKFKVTLAPSVSTPKQKVMSQDPGPGTGVPPGSVVQLTVSSGPV